MFDIGNFVEVFIGDYAVRRVGNNERPSMAGVDAAGAAFLLPDSFQTDGVVFAFAAYYRNSNPVRFQLWTPVDASEDDGQQTTPPRVSSLYTSVRLLAHYTVTPSVKDAHETVRNITLYSQ